jgi:Tfp pilus assembly protein PilN
MKGRRGTRIGIALGDTRVVAVLVGRKGAPSASASVDLGEADAADVPGELRRVFRELKATLDSSADGLTTGATAHVAVLPPLADVRVVPFPPMRRAEVQAVLSRDVARYFLGANRPRVVGVRLPAGNGGSRGKSRGASMQVLAAAAPMSFLEAVRTALGQVGWVAGSFGAAQGGWLAAALAFPGTPVRAVVAVLGDVAHVLRLEGGRVLGVRQLPAGDPEAVAKGVGSGPGRVLLLAPPPTFEALERVLAKGGWVSFRDPDGWAGAEESAAAMAGLGGLDLDPPSLTWARREATRKRALWMGAGAFVLLAASAAATLWGAQRELAAIQDRRAEIRGDVAPLLSSRDRLNELVARAGSMEELSGSSPVWNRTLLELAVVLPEDTYLTGFYASGDTVELRAAGSRAGEAIQALREAGIFQEVRLQGRVERELAEGETVVERFRLWARLPGGDEGEVEP